MKSEPTSLVPAVGFVFGVFLVAVLCVYGVSIP